MDFFNYFSRNQHIRNYKKRYSDFKEENHCRPVLFDFKNAKKKKKKIIYQQYMLLCYVKWVFTVSLPKHTLQINFDKSRGYEGQCLC